MEVIRPGQEKPWPTTVCVEYCGPRDEQPWPTPERTLSYFLYGVNFLGSRSSCYTTPMIEIVYFDYHGVLDRRTPAGLWSAIATAAKTDPATVAAALAQHFYAYCTGSLTSLDFWRAVEQQYGAGVVRVGKKYWLHVDPIRASWDVVNALQVHTTLGLFSDCPADKKNAVRGAYNLPDYFSNLIFSCDVGWSKRDVAFYRLLLADGKYQESQCLLIDDDAEVVELASSLGFLSHQFSTATELRQYLLSAGYTLAP